MLGMLLRLFIYLIPMVAIVFFIVSIINFIEAKKQYKADPNEANLQKKNATRTLLIVSSVIFGILLTVIIAFMSLMFVAVAYM